MEDRQAGLLVVFIVYMLLVLGASVLASLKNVRKQRDRVTADATAAASAAASLAASAAVTTTRSASTKSLGDTANQATLEQHFLGGRSFGWIVTILTLAGTIYSGYSLIAVPADFGKNGFIGVRWFGNTVSVQFGAMLLAPRLRRLSMRRGYISPLAFIQDRWRSPFLTYFSVVAVGVPALFFLTAQVMSLRLMVESVFDGVLEPHSTTAILCAIMVGYEWFGGMTSVAWTDVMQGIIMTIGTVVGAFLVADQYGGFETCRDRLQALRPEWYLVPTRRQQLMMFMYAFGAMAFFCNPFCITRVYASKSYRFVGWSMSAVALMEMIIKMPGMLLGLQGAANLPDVAPGDLFGEVSLELMGRGWFAAAVMALLLVAAMAAIMSTADSSLMAITNITANDLFRRVRPDAPAWSFKLVGIVAMVAAVGLSYVFTDLSALWILQNSLLMVGVAPSLVLGLYVPSMHPGCVCLGIGFGLAIALSLGFAFMDDDSHPGAELKLASNAIGLACGMALTAGCHAAERRMPQGLFAALLERVADGFFELPRRAHDPAYDAEPLVLKDHLDGLVEPLQGRRAVLACSFFALCEAFYVPWYLTPGDEPSWHFTGIPGWACVTIFFSSAGCATSLYLWTRWRDADEDAQLRKVEDEVSTPHLQLELSQSVSGHL